MIYVGIDFSMNSTGVCIDTGREELFLNFRRTKLLKRTTEVYQNSDILFFDLDTIEKKVTYSDIESEKITKAIITAESIYNNIIELTGVVNTGEKLSIGIEGFSYGGVGTRVLDLAGFQYILRYLLATSPYVESFYFYPPTTVKKYAVKGNAKKEEMVQAFLQLELHTPLNEIAQLIEEKDTYAGPFTDLVDAYYIKELLKN